MKHFRSKYEERRQQHIAQSRMAENTSLTPPFRRQRSPTRTSEYLAEALLQSDPVTEEEAYMTRFGVTSPDGVQVKLASSFINNELNLQHINVYGFDYDYTLANYTPELSKIIYDLLRDILVEHLRYPAALRNFKFDPSFAIRGLHYVHDGTHIPPNYLAQNMYQLNDLFSVPEACLLADILQFFNDEGMSFQPRYLYDDLKYAGRILHSGGSRSAMGGQLHQHVVADLDRYLHKDEWLVSHLERLRAAKKKVFLLTNSGYEFVNAGLRHITGRKDWKDLFDFIGVWADKPRFYRDHRPFRRVGQASFENVDEVGRGEVVTGGSLAEFSRITGWAGSPELFALINEWRAERWHVRMDLKTVFNRQFGSVFRTHHNPSFFANKIRKNFDGYPLDYVFYPERTYLPHERIAEMLVDSGKLKASR
ncbi:hypothetical protein BZG36_02643 [Bifiguratus adelaidae]|uniref:5'-nucleotidase domain-containing protein n=1 Tax=Bifiguratus adelaidae TaxID=1938954 RepID=A0A261Y2W9_9FUNG|nr:hypothetical protein BZG36_02643 [Bifiguratus adelaidae]